MGVVEYEVGKPFPDPALTEQIGAGWHADAGLILICDTGFREDDTAQFADMRLYLAAEGPMIGLLLDSGVGAVEVPTCRLAGPPSFFGDESRAVFSLVIVNFDSQLVVGLRTFTVSPHFTAALRREAAARWASALSEEDVPAAVEQWRSRFPDPRAFKRQAIASTRSGG